MRVIVWVLRAVVLANIWYAGASWSTEPFKQALDQLANDGLGVKAFEDYINDEQVYETHAVDGATIVRQIAEKLQPRLVSLTGILRELREVIEDSVTGQVRSDINVTRCCDHSSGQFDERFRRKIDTSSLCMSGLGQPAEPFYSRVLDRMKLNLQSQPALRWQYFAIELNGLVFSYPASQLCPSSNYDPRLRPWYLATANPRAKDVVVLVQKSASMNQIFCETGKSRALTHAKSAASAIVRALSPQDRAAVVSFSHEVASSSVDACYGNQLSVINPTVKADLQHFIDHIQTDDTDANYSAAFSRAFSIFDANDRYTRRDRLIVLLTNGDRVHVDINNTLDVIRQGNQPFGNKVAILIYSLQKDGLTETLQAHLRRIAQQQHNDRTAGEVAPGGLTALNCESSARSQMTDYFTRGVQLSETSAVVYSRPYYDRLGIGLVMSLCLPVVFARQSQLRGVTCVDVTVDRLFAEVEFYGTGSTSSSSYAFLVDGAGGVLLHPLLPRLLPTTSHELPLADITDLENDPDGKINTLRLAMITNDTGQMNLRARKISPRGNTELKGIYTDQKDSVYYWQKLTGTNFSVCVVVSMGDSSSAVTWSGQFPPAGTLDFDPEDLSDPPRCNQHGRIALQSGKTSVHLAQRSFVNSAKYLDIPASQATMRAWKDYLEGRAHTSEDIKPSIRAIVAATYKLEEIWLQRNVCGYGIWRYIGLKEGVFRKTPGTRMARGYDPTRRPWYRKAIADGPYYSIHGPYTDASRTGCLVSLAKSIIKRHHAPAAPETIGVIAMTFTLEHFHDMLQKTFAPCSQRYHKCIVIDRSGFVIMHPSFSSVRAPEDCQQAGKQHITCLEPEVADELIRAQVLVSDTCFSFANNKLLKFWKVDSLASTMFRNISSARLVVAGVAETNIYVIDKYYSDKPTGTCSLEISSNENCDAASNDNRKTLREYPCYYATSYRQRCLGQLANNRSWTPCVPDQPALDIADLTRSEAVKSRAMRHCNATCFNQESGDSPLTLLALPAVFVIITAAVILGMLWRRRHSRRGHTNADEVDEPRCSNVDEPTTTESSGTYELPEPKEESLYSVLDDINAYASESCS